tara:strand:- start:261 stop:1958 length:1698 start_codon:yes stop_codon:yes gene_type:complete
MTKKLLFLINKFKKGSYTYLIFALILGAVFETFSIAAIYPLMKLIMDQNYYYLLIEKITFLDSFNYNIFVNLSLFTVFMTYFIKLIYLCYLNFVQVKFVADIETKSAETLYKAYLSKNYLEMIDKDSGFETSNIINDSVAFGKAVLVFTTIIIEITILLFIALMISFFIGYKTIFVLFFFVVISLIVHNYFKGLFQKWGVDKRIFHGERLGVLQESMFAYKLIKVMKLENFFKKKFFPININSIEVIRKQNFAISLPKIFYEFLAVISFLIIFYYMKLSYSNNEIVPALAIIAATAFRVLPAFSRLFQSLQGLKYFKKSVENVYDISKINPLIVEPSIDENRKIIFNKVIEFKNIFFYYPGKKYEIFHNLNFSIKKNEMIGILGESGSGKSTFLDIFCGLIKPQKGEFFVDNKFIKSLDSSWRDNFAYVQQTTTIFDESFKANIILDRPFDKKLFLNIISIVKLDNFLKTLPNSIDTKLGELGSRISGGESQRIGIARALYRCPSILIMDEPTSSLDSQTENDLIENLLDLKEKNTSIIISHKFSTLKNCDKIYEIKNNSMIQKK